MTVDTEISASQRSWPRPRPSRCSDARRDGSALRSRDGPPGGCSLLRHARPANDDAQPGHVPGRGRHRADGDRHRPVDRRWRGHWLDRLPGRADTLAAAHRPVRQLRRGPGRGAGKAQADSLRATRQDTPAYRLDSLESQNGQFVPSTQLRTGDLVLVEAGQVIPADGEVVEGVASVDETAHHRRECPGHSRGRRRPLGRDRRHPGPLRPDRRAGHGRARPELPRPDDRPGRGGDPPEDAQRDRADDRAGRVLAHLPDRHGRALPDGPVLRPDPRHPDVDRAARSA